MHKFLRAAGFSEFTSEESVYNFIWQQVMRPDNLAMRLELDSRSTLFEYRQPLNEHVGLCAAILHMPGLPPAVQYYYPYYNTYEISSGGICTLERHTPTETYAGVIDEYNIGLSLIFFMTNPLDYRKRPDRDANDEFRGTALAAFSNYAMILLPVAHTETIGKGYDTGYRDAGLMEAAMNGDEDAIETLTASDINMYHEISERVENEDLYSIVDQSFMPCGIECDQYSIIGEIVDLDETENSFTKEALWLIRVSCNDVEFCMCIRKDDVLGEPMKGRRIKCRLWMQGSVNVGD